jgi:sec-independent protein translocase protein TatC
MGTRSTFLLPNRLFRRVSTNATPAEDLFAETRMPFGDHLEELRRRLVRAVAGLGVALAVVFLADLTGYFTGTSIGIGKPVMDLITAPVEKSLQRFYDRRLEQVAQDIQTDRISTEGINAPREVIEEVDINTLSRAIAARLGINAAYRPQDDGGPCYVPVPIRIKPLDWALSLSAAQRLVGIRPGLQTMSITEAMTVYLQAAIVCGLVLASPWVFWQLWAFVAAGLHPEEKRPLRLYLPFSIALFLAGVVVCQLVVVPQAVEALLWFNEWLRFEPTLRLSEWLGFAIFMPALFGIAFQTPLIMLFLQRLRLVSVDTYRRKRRWPGSSSRSLPPSPRRQTTPSPCSTYWDPCAFCTSWASCSADSLPTPRISQK